MAFGSADAASDLISPDSIQQHHCRTLTLPIAIGHICALLPVDNIEFTRRGLLIGLMTSTLARQGIHV